MKDRLPREPNRRVEIGDSVTFRDYKEGKMRVGRITGQDGNISLIKWCNHERRVPTRELMPTREQREMLEDGDTDIDDTDEIIIPEKPGKIDGPRRKKLEVIECPTSIEIKRELKSRPLEEDIQSDESDHLPKRRVVYSSEDKTLKVVTTRKKKKVLIERIEGEGRP